jgi:hypothetical protein
MDGRLARPASQRLSRIVIGILIGVLIGFLVLPGVLGTLLLAFGAVD